MARGTPRSSDGRCGRRFFRVRASSSGDDVLREDRDGPPVDDPPASPRVDRGEKAGAVFRGVPRGGEKVRQEPALLFGARRLGRAVRHGVDAPVVRDRRPAPEQLHRQVPHHVEAEGEAGEIRAAEASDPLSLGRDGVDRALHVHLGEVGVDGGRVRLLRRHAAALAKARRRRVRVGERELLVGEPAVGDEPAGSGGVQDVAAPERVDAEDGLGDVVVETGQHGRLPTKYRPSPFLAFAEGRP